MGGLTRAELQAYDSIARSAKTLERIAASLERIATVLEAQEKGKRLDALP